MMSTEDLSRMSLRDMETHVKQMVEDYLERQHVMDKRKWMTAYDLRGIVKVDAKRQERRKPVYVLDGRGKEVEISSTYGVQSGFVGTNSRYKLYNDKKPGLDNIENMKRN